MAISMFSKKAFGLWLERQDPETTYDFFDSFDCLGLRYLKYLGFDLNTGISEAYTSLDMGEILCPSPWTYKAALERLKASK